MGALDGQVAIVTGASSGIGAETASALAGEGATVVCASRRLDRLEHLAGSIIAKGGRAVALRCDITSEADRGNLVEEVLRRSGRMDVLVNNAGWGQRGPVEAVPINLIRENFESNVFGPLALTQRVVAVMRAQRSGRIVNVSSIAGRIARPYSSVYDATKHAIEALSDGMRLELGPFGIHVIVVQPGFIETEFGEVALLHDIAHEAYAEHRSRFNEQETKRRRMGGKPEEIGRLIAAACAAPSPRARYAAPRFARVALLLKRILPEALFERVAGLAL